MKKISLYTRPLAPPWDEASKNLAWDISQNLEGDFDLEILTTKEFSKAINSKNHLKESYFAKIFPKAIFDSPTFNKSAKIRLMRHLFEIKKNTDIIHLLFTPRKLTSALFKLKLAGLKAKTIQTIATFPIKNERDLSIEKAKKILFADKIITLSKFTEKKLQNIGFKNTQTIYPGIDLEKFSPKPKSKSALKTLGLKEDDLIILYAGEYLRLGKNNVDKIIDSFEILLKKNIKNKKALKLVLAIRIKSKEDKLKKQEVVQKAEKFKLLKQIIFVDFFAQMPELFNLSDINIFPADKMAGKVDVPYVIIEPMACGKPVIATKLEVLEEFVQNDFNGLLIPKKNWEKELARKIANLIKDKNQLKRLGKNARQYVEENFDIKKTAKKYQKIYSNLR